MAELGLKKAELELFGGNIQASTKIGSSSIMVTLIARVFILSLLSFFYSFILLFFRSFILMLNNRMIIFYLPLTTGSYHTHYNLFSVYLLQLPNTFLAHLRYSLYEKKTAYSSVHCLHYLSFFD